MFQAGTSKPRLDELEDAAQMENAEFKINNPALLIETCTAIDAMQVSGQCQDVQGDLCECLLSKLNTTNM